MLETPLSEWEKDCLTLLSGMPAGQETAWGKAQAQVYRVVLAAMGEAASRYAVQQAILIEQWRPAPARLREIAESQIGAKRGASEVVGEIWQAIREHGLYGRPDPENRNCRLYGPPPLSIEAQATVASMGGWEALCTMQAPDGVTQGHLRKAAEDVLTQREIEAKRRVSLENLLPSMPSTSGIGRTLPEGKAHGTSTV